MRHRGIKKPPGFTKLPSLLVPGESPVATALTPEQAKQRHKVWDREFSEWMLSRNLMPVFRGARNDNWDKLPPSTRKQLEEIWDTGHDRVTRQKLGLFVEN